MWDIPLCASLCVFIFIFFFNAEPIFLAVSPSLAGADPGARGRALDSCGLRALARRLQVGDLAAPRSSSCSCLGSLLGKCSCPISVILFDFCFVKGGARRPRGLGGRSRQSVLSFPFLLFPSFLLNSVSITLLAHGAPRALPKRLGRASVCRARLCPHLLGQVPSPGLTRSI